MNHRPNPTASPAARELQALLRAAAPRFTLAAGPAPARAERAGEPWECGWYESSWSLRRGLVVRECAVDEWMAAAAAA